MKRNTRPYTTEDIQFIIENYPTMTNEALADALGRHPHSISRIAIQYGVQKLSSQGRPRKSRAPKAKPIHPTKPLPPGPLPVGIVSIRIHRIF